MTICTVLDKLIKFRMGLYNERSEEMNHYKSRSEQFEKWKQSRMLDYEKVTPGLVVDVRDTETIWCQGKIIDVYKTFDKKKGKEITTAILVHYNRWHNIYN